MGIINGKIRLGGSDLIIYSIQQTTDGGYILGGYSDSNISGDKTENCLGLMTTGLLKLIHWEIFNGKIRLVGV
ncbi:MAG: hypothetical protein IPO63_11390 [Bacteroidetes bacterium]|nr:hypothetical protein [Bacteroidota bacterium]